MLVWGFLSLVSLFMELKKIKACAHCGKEFRLFKTTDKYCSYSCYSKNTEQKKPKIYRINRRSKKRESEERAYLRDRKIFLTLPENKYCPVAQLIFNKRIRAYEVHHKAGRIGRLLNYQPFWLAVSTDGHLWIDNNPEEAYKYGFLINSSHINLK